MHKTAFKTNKQAKQQAGQKASILFVSTGWVVGGYAADVDLQLVITG